MNIQEMMRQAQRMQKKLAKVQEETGNLTAEGSAGGGMVVVVTNGRNEVQSVKIEKEVVDADEIEMLQDLIMAATNQAMQRVNEIRQKEMEKVTGGMGLPPGLV